MSKTDWENIEVDEGYREIVEILVEFKGNCTFLSEHDCDDCPFNEVCSRTYTDEQTYADAKEYLRRLDGGKE